MLERFAIGLLIGTLIVFIKRTLKPKIPESRKEYDREMQAIDEYNRYKKGGYCCVAPRDYSKYQGR